MFPGSIARKILFLLFIVASLTWSSCRTEDDDPNVTANEELYINEVNSDDDWIELYNNNTTARDIGGYKIYDDPQTKYVLPAGTTLPAKGFLVIFCDDLNEGLHTNFKLSSAGETVWLENNSGDVIDKVI